MAYSLIIILCFVVLSFEIDIVADRWLAAGQTNTITGASSVRGQLGSFDAPAAQEQHTQTGLFVDNFTTNITANVYINQSTIKNVTWDGSSRYLNTGRPAEIVSDAALVGLWHMNDNVVGEGQIIQDSSAYGNNGVLSLGPDCTVAGYFGRGCDFVYDGWSRFDEYIEIQDSDVLDLTSPNVTITAWINPRSWGEAQWGRIIDHGGSGASQSGWSLEVFNRSAYPETFRLEVNNVPSVTASDAHSARSGVWQHVAVTFNPLTFYVNGIRRSSYTGWVASSASPAPVRIGISAVALNHEFDGTVDEIALFNRSLTSDEVRTLAGSGSFQSTRIDTSGLFYALNVSWVANTSDANVGAEISTDNGTTWCKMHNGAVLRQWDDCMPGNSLMYRMTFLSAIDSITANWSLPVAGPPVITIQNPQNTTYGSSAIFGIALNITVSEDVTGCGYSIGNGTFMSDNFSLFLNGCYNASIPAFSGFNVIRVYATDVTGLTASASVNFTVSEIATTVTIQEPQNRTYNSTLRTLNFTAGSDISACRYSLNEGSNTTLAGCQNTTFTAASGFNVVRVVVNDTQNITASDDVTFTIDSTPPTLSLQQPQNATYTSINRTLNFTTNADACWYRLGGSSVQLAGCRNTTLLASAGRNLLRLFVNDSANNTVGAEVNFTVTPLQIVADPVVSGINGTRATISWDTNSAADSLVKYGTTSGVYLNTNVNTTQTANHSVFLAGLQPATTYYYVVNSTGGGLSVQSTEDSFATLATPVCTLTSASWNVATINENQQVTLTVAGTNCDSETIAFAVWEADEGTEFGGNDPVVVQPASAVMSGGVATTTWTAEWQEDGLFGVWNPPEYEFNASFAASVVESSEPDLTVYKQDNPVVTLLSPANGAALPAGSIAFSCSATDGDGVDSIVLLVNETPIFTENDPELHDNILTTAVSLAPGAYVWRCTATDMLGYQGTSITSALTLSVPLSPGIHFVSPTPENGTTTANTSVLINVSMIIPSLKTVTYNWNGTNYTLFDESALLVLNLDNASLLGENASSTNVHDASFYSMNATCRNVGAVCNWTTGVYSTAMSFDGIDDYIDLGNPDALKLTGSMSVAAWLYERSFPADDGFAVGKMGYGTGAFGWHLKSSIDVGLRSFAFAVFDPSETYAGRYGTTLMNANTWYFVVGTYNASAQTLHIYVNGKLDDGTLVGTVPSSQKDSPKNVSIGNSMYANGGPNIWIWDGLIDEVRIWSRSLSAQEVYELYVSRLKKHDAENWTLYVNQSRNATAGLANGSYTYQAFASDRSGNANRTEMRTITIGSTQGAVISVAIQQPQNTTYNSTVRTLNFTAGPSLSQCWYTLNGGARVSLPGCLNTTLTAAAGFNGLYISVNDTANNTANAQVNFTIDTIPPTVSLQQPQNRTYNSTARTLNFTAGPDVTGCWYSLNNGANVTLTNCLNNTFAASEGINRLRVYVNDTANNTDASPATTTEQNVQFNSTIAQFHRRPGRHRLLVFVKQRTACNAFRLPEHDVCCSRGIEHHHGHGQRQCEQHRQHTGKLYRRYHAADACVAAAPEHNIQRCSSDA